MILRASGAIFYPASVLLLGIMIFLPLLLNGRQQTQRIQNIIDFGIIADFDRLQSLVTGPGISMAVASDGRGGQTVAVTAGNYLGDPNITPSAGGFIPLSPRELGVVQGHSLRVSFFVEAAPGSDVDLVNVGVFQRGIGQNGWELHEFPPQNEPIIVTVTPPQCEAEYGFFGVWPSAIGEPGVLHLNRIHVEILEPLDCGERS